MPDGDTGTAAPASSQEGFVGRLSELAWKALPAIASAISFVGFVAIIGGAIEWIRFDAAGLPATQAVLAVPKQELVVIGALALGVFVIGAFLAVLIVYLIDSDGNATPRTARGLIAVGALEIAVTLWFIGHHHEGKYVWVGIWLILILLLAGDYVGLVMRDFRRRTKVKKARAALLAARSAFASGEGRRIAAQLAVNRQPTEKAKESDAEAAGNAATAQADFKQAICDWVIAANRVIELQDRERAADKRKLSPIRERVATVEQLARTLPGGVELEAALDEAERRLGHAYGAAWAQLVMQVPGFVDWLKTRGRFTSIKTPTPDLARTIVICVGLSALALICAGCVVFACEVSWAAILFLVVALLTAMNVFVARATDKFALYGIVVFFSVLLFGAALTIARTLHEPKVQPVALLRKGKELGICGVYITQTSERVYVGRLRTPTKRRPGLIFWVPMSEVELVSVGQPESISVEKAKKTSPAKKAGGKSAKKAGAKLPESAGAKDSRTREDKNEHPFAVAAERMLERLYKERAEEAAPVLKNETVTEEVSKPSSGKQAKKVSGGQVVKSIETREVPPKLERPKHHPAVKIYGESCTATQHVDP